MAFTTIKVSDGLRDRLKVDAQRHGHTMNEHSQYLLEENERRTRISFVGAGIARSYARWRVRL